MAMKWVGLFLGFEFKFFLIFLLNLIFFGGGILFFFFIKYFNNIYSYISVSIK